MKIGRDQTLTATRQVEKRKSASLVAHGVDRRSSEGPRCSKSIRSSEKRPPGRLPPAALRRGDRASRGKALECMSNAAGPCEPKTKAGGRRARRFSSNTILITGHHKLQIRKLFQMTFLGSGIVQGKFVVADASVRWGIDDNSISLLAFWRQGYFR